MRSWLLGSVALRASSSELASASLSDRDIPKGTLNQIAKDLGFVNGHQLALACRNKGAVRP